MEHSNQEDSRLNSLAWLILYGEEFENIPDPNKPENQAHFAAKRQLRADQFKALMKGPGKVLFDQWSDDIKKLNIMLITDGRIGGCGSVCPMVVMLSEIKSKLKLWLEAESIVNENR